MTTTTTSSPIQSLKPVLTCVPKTRVLEYFRFGIDDTPAWFTSHLAKHFPDQLNKSSISTASFKIVRGDYVVWDPTIKAITNICEYKAFSSAYVKL